MVQNYQLPLAAKQEIQQAKSQDRIIVLVTGVFDVLHREHIKFLEKAQGVGDILVVGVETDERVRAMKTNDRPVNREQERVEQLRQTGLPDAVFLLPEQFDNERQHRSFLKILEPDVLAVSSHTPYLNEKKKLMNEIGGVLKVVHQHSPEISSTKIIEQNKQAEDE